MSAFSKAATPISASVAGMFSVATGSPAALKSDIVAGISALDGQSFGNDMGFGFKPAALNM